MSYKLKHFSARLSIAALSLFGALGLSSAFGAQADVAAALAHPDRPDADTENDARRMPEQVLAFAGLEVGMDVLELEAGGGYYTEILSRAVGETGSVVLHHAPGLMGFVGDGINRHTEGNRLANVSVSITNFDALADGEGLRLAKSSELLKNADDPLDVGVFAPAVRGKTSQFLVVYTK